MLLNHPLVQTPGSGWVDDHMVDPPEQYWQLGPYLLEAANQEQVGPGVNITFHHRPLSRYLNAAAERGLCLQRMEEPPPPEGFIARAPEYEYQRTIPRMLFLRFSRDDPRESPRARTASVGVWSTSCSSPECRVPDARRPVTPWRISAGSSSTTCPSS